MIPALPLWDDSCLTIKEQAELLTLNRTGLYRKAKEPAELEVKIKHLLLFDTTIEPVGKTSVKFRTATV
ncbi:MAG: hypothetical protein M1489_00975 [Firmicutes bacterium]|nr:hypothetical protein [Bacillota bacterium]